MTHTKILLFHPDLAKSRANAALADAAWTLPDVEIVDMAARHPTGAVAGADEDAALLLSADRIVLLFPLQWYSTPPLLKAWQDAVLTRMFYIRADEGSRLEDVPVMLAVTAGNEAGAYAAEGANLFPLDELLRPLQATAHRCGLVWSDPFLLYRANRLDDAALEEAGRHYRTRLENWIAATPRH